MELNNDTLRKLRGLILYTVILVAAAVNYKGILSVGQTLLGFIWPFILGAAIAFILNVPMRNIERRLPLFRPVSRASCFWERFSNGQRSCLRVIRSLRSCLIR